MLAKIGAKFYLNFGPIETKLSSSFCCPELILILNNIFFYLALISVLTHGLSHTFRGLLSCFIFYLFCEILESLFGCQMEVKMAV